LTPRKSADENLNSFFSLDGFFTVEEEHAQTTQAKKENKKAV
jgi:hypothetical protein